MRESIEKLIALTSTFVLTIAALFLVTAWNFQPVDIAVEFTFLIGVAVCVWATRVWYDL